MAFLALCKNVKENKDKDYFLIKYGFYFDFCFYSKSKPKQVSAKSCYSPPPSYFFLNCIFICLAELMMKIFPAVTLPESLSEAPTNLD